MVPGGARRGAGGPGALPLPPRAGRGREPPAERLGVDLRRPGVDAGRGRRVVPAPLRTRAAGPGLDPPGGHGGIRLGPPLLARPWRRRLPHRRRPRHGQGRRPAGHRPRRPGHADRRRAAAVLRPGRGPRDPPLVAAPPRLLRGGAHRGRGGVGPVVGAARPVRPPGRAPPGLQLPLPELSVGPGGDADGDRRVPVRHHGGGRPHHLGPVEPRRGPPRHPLRRRPARPRPGPGRGHADAVPPGLGVPLPGRGTGPPGGVGPPPGLPPGPGVPPRPPPADPRARGCPRPGSCDPRHHRPPPGRTPHPAGSWNRQRTGSRRRARARTAARAAGARPHPAAGRCQYRARARGAGTDRAGGRGGHRAAGPGVLRAGGRDGGRGRARSADRAGGGGAGRVA